MIPLYKLISSSLSLLIEKRVGKHCCPARYTSNSQKNSQLRMKDIANRIVQTRRFGADVLLVMFAYCVCVSAMRYTAAGEILTWL